MPENLWPDFDVGKQPRSPRSVIEEAGAGLAKRTRGAVQFYAYPIGLKDGTVTASFSLYTRALSYHFPFLIAQFTIASPYPVTLVAQTMAEGAIVAKDESELSEALRRIFTAPTTVEAVERLMSLAQK